MACLAAITSLWGCTPPVTWQALQAQGFGPKITDSCVRLPPFGERGEFFTYNDTNHEMVSDENPEAFWKAARTASTIYRYDPNALADARASLPWPYHNMTCDEVSSGDVPELPDGMKEVIISHQYREALVQALVSRNLRAGASEDTGDKPPPELVGQALYSRPPRLEDVQKSIEDVAQVLRDAVRGHLPTVKREGGFPSDGDISIIDTKEGQIIGGLGAGFAIGSVPGGTFIAQGTMASGPKPTREFILAEGLGEMGSGGVQFTVGTGMGAGGAGLSLTGGGALLGVPTCAAGIALAANGAVTFINGGRKVIVALCHWEELPAASSAASAESASTSSTGGTPSTATNSGPPAGTAAGGASARPTAPAAAAKPAPAAAPAKPAAAPAKPVATSPTPPQAEPTLHLGRHLGSGKKISANTTTWVRCTGQRHHAISKEIHKELQKHAVLKDVYKARDNRFVTQAIDKAAHNGYETWHRNMEIEVIAWLKRESAATPSQFEEYLRNLYQTHKDLAPRFPNGL